MKKYDLRIFFAVMLLLLILFSKDYIILNSKIDLNVYTIESYKGYFFTWNSILSLGGNNSWLNSYIFPYGFIYFIFQLLFKNIYFTQAVIHSIIFFLGYYFFILFIKNEFKTDSLYVHLGGILYIFNLYIILTLSDFYFILLFPFFVLPIQLYLLNKLILNEKPFIYPILFSFITLIMGGVNPPLSVINLIIIIFYFGHLFFKYKLYRNYRSLLYRLSIVIILFLLINLYWIIGWISYFCCGANFSEILSEPISIKNMASSFLNIFRTIGLWSFHSSYLGEPYYSYSSTYLKSPLFIFTLFLYPLIFITSFFKKNKDTIWILILGLLAIAMAVASNQGLFAEIYKWSYNNLPLFSMFRGNYKFVSVYIFCLSYLLAFIFISFKNKSLKKIMAVIILSLILINSFPLFNGEVFNQNSKIKNIPSYYYDSQKLLSTDLTNHRILLLPPQYFAIYNWGYTKANVEIILNKPLAVRGSGTLQQDNNNLTQTTYDYLFNHDYIKANDMFWRLNVKYIIQRNDYNWEYYPKISESPEVVKEALKPYKKVTSFGELDIYKVPEENINSLISSQNGGFKQINPTKYNQYILNITNSQNLSFLESYHKEWKLYLVKNPTNSWCNPIEFYNTTNTTECKHTQKFFEGEEFSYLWKKPIFDDTHTMVYDYANQWTIDPQYIKDNYSKDYYTENLDGSINIELVMYFEPQSYFYIGLIISGTTLILCIVYLVYDWRKERKSKKLNNNSIPINENFKHETN